MEYDLQLVTWTGDSQWWAWRSVLARCQREGASSWSSEAVCTAGSAGGRPGGPMIGDYVMLSAHSFVLGPVHVDDGAIVGSGAVVVSDFPADAVAVGVPERTRSANWPEDAATYSA